MTAAHGTHNANEGLTHGAALRRIKPRAGVACGVHLNGFFAISVNSPSMSMVKSFLLR
jgi:hypothetical protein